MSRHLNINAENPWPGLESYDEAASPWFHGRANEAGALFRLVERETLSVLFGRSGLGKTSLIQAGLFPLLRQADYLPIHVHLLLADDAADLRQQIGQAIARECTNHRIEAPAYDGTVSLWEYFSLKGGEFWSEDDRMITPVLIFDQFEEIFTLGRESHDRRERCDRLLAEIGDLVENRRPEALRRRIEADPAAADQFDSRRPPPRILLSFREDYLADFDILYEYLRARTGNRLRLLPMNGETAQAAVAAAGGAHVSAELAARIVNFIDPRPLPAHELIIEPVLLSLVCRKLNERRQQEHEAAIRVEWLADGSAAAIIERFYEDAFAGLPPQLRHFVEDHLLTASGHRDSCALDNALTTPGISESALQTLTERRLLRRDPRGGQVRLELIHDVLAPVAMRSRTNRVQHEAMAAQRRQRKRLIAFVATLAVTTLIFTVLSTFGWQQWRRANSQWEAAETSRKDAETARKNAEYITEILETTLERYDPITVSSLIYTSLRNTKEPIDHHRIIAESIRSALISATKHTIPDREEISIESKIRWAIMTGNFYGDWTYWKEAHEQAISSYELSQNSENMPLDIRVKAINLLGRTTREHTNNYDESVSYHKRAMEILTEERVESSDLMAKTKSLLATAYLERGRPTDLQEGERHAIQALELQTSLYGRNHEESLITMNTLARIYRAQYDNNTIEICGLREGTKCALNAPRDLLRKAIDLQRYILENRLTFLEESSSQVLSTMNNLAYALFLDERKDEAIDLFERAYEIRRTYYGSFHPGTLLVQSNLARALLDAGGDENTKRAKALACEAFIGRSEVHKDHQHRASTTRSAATLFFALIKNGRKDAADRLYKENIEWLFNEDYDSLGELNRRTLRYMRSIIEREQYLFAETNMQHNEPYCSYAESRLDTH